MGHISLPQACFVSSRPQADSKSALSARGLVLLADSSHQSEHNGSCCCSKSHAQEYTPHTTAKEEQCCIRELGLEEAETDFLGLSPLAVCFGDQNRRCFSRMRSPSAFVSSHMRSPTAFGSFAFSFTDSELKSDDVSGNATDVNSLPCMSPLDAYLKGLDYHDFGLGVLTETDEQRIDSVISSDGAIVAVSTQGALTGRVWLLSQDEKGCWDVQNALDEFAHDEDRWSIAAELQGHVLEAIRCRHANHVLRKVIKTTPSAYSFIIAELMEAGPAAIIEISKHQYGSRIMRELLSCCAAAVQLADVLLAEAEAVALCTNRYGNLVMQHLLTPKDYLSCHEEYRQRASLLKVILSHPEAIGTSFYGCAVVETAIQHSTGDEQLALARAFSNSGGLLAAMSRSNRGKTAVNSLLGVLPADERLGAQWELSLSHAKVSKRTRRC